MALQSTALQQTTTHWLGRALAQSCAALLLLGLSACSKKEEPAPAAAPAASAPLTAKSAEPLKIAFAYVGPVGDAGWTYAHDRGRKAIVDTFGSKVSTSFVENVPEAADACGNTVRRLASMRCPLTYTAARLVRRTCSTMDCGTSTTTRRYCSEMPLISGVPGATVSPTSMWRRVTMPAYGARISVYAIPSRALSTPARAEASRAAQGKFS